MASPVPHLILIDSDLKRRAAISHALSADGMHAEPFETIDELGRAWPRSGLVLLHDAPDALAGLIGRMADAGEWFPIVAFDEAPSPQAIVDAILGGAVDYLCWPFAATELHAMLVRAESRAENLGGAKLREAMARGRIDRLTNREREVLAGVASGMSNRLIGEKLAISPRTVEIHRANMLNKLGANHTSDAIRIAVEAALIT